MGFLKLSSYIGSGLFCFFLKPILGLDFLHSFGTVIFPKIRNSTGEKKGAYSYEPPQTGGYVSNNIVEIAL